MSFQPRPVEIADEVIQQLAFAKEPDMDEFSINRYIQKLRSILNHRLLKPREYQALGTLYFAQKRYDKFEEALKEGLRQYPDNFEILSSYMIGLFSIKQFGLKDTGFDLYDEWFNHPANAEKKPIIINSGVHGSEVFGKKIVFKKSMRIRLILNRDRVFDVRTGPYKKNVGYDDMKRINFDFSDIVLVDLLNNLACGKVTKDEIDYFKEILGDENFKIIEKMAFADPTDETVSAIESNEYDEEFDSVDELFKSLYSD